MSHKISYLSFLLLLSSMATANEKTSLGPLSEMNCFEVIPLFSSFEKFDNDHLFNELVDSLKEIGQVEIIPKEALDAASIAEVIASSPLAEAIDAADKRLAAGRKPAECRAKAPKDCIPAIPDQSTILFVSLGGYQEPNKGSIEIHSPVAIVANDYKTYCSIWRFEFREKNLPCPVIEDGKVSFSRDASPAPKSSTDDVLIDLISHFSEEYRSANPADPKPIFHVYISE